MESKVFCLRLWGRSPKKAVIWSIIFQILINFPTGRDLSPSSCGLICTPEIMNGNRAGVREVLAWCRFWTGLERGARVWSLACWLWWGDLFQIQPHLGPQITNLLRPQGSEISSRDHVPSSPAKQKDSLQWSVDEELMLQLHARLVTWACKKHAPFGDSVKSGTGGWRRTSGMVL